ncbi:unnamed protein product, partial [Didymodactylos carnosus]
MPFTMATTNSSVPTVGATTATTTTTSITSAGAPGESIHHHTQSAS